MTCARWMWVALLGACGASGDGGPAGSGTNSMSADGSGGPSSAGESDSAPGTQSGTDESGGSGAVSSDSGVSGGETDADTGGQPGSADLEGYGTLSPFGSGGETCVVTNLDDAGPGSLRDCVVNRDTTDDNPTPRVVTFEVGGMIQPVSDIRVRQPFLTIDGLSAPEPGITIEKTGDGQDGEFAINTWPNNATCGHDVLVQGIRFRGVWPGESEEHSQNAGTIALDGEDLPLCLRNVVLNRITVVDAQDSGGDIWGSASDVTVQYSAFLKSLHPNTLSHAPGNAPDQQRERLSFHHNLYALIHERGPQVRGNVWDSNFEQNIMHRWADYGFGGGYAMRLRCRDGFCPQRLNVLENHFTSGGARLDAAIILGESAGSDADDAQIAPQVHSAGNRVPAENLDDGSAAAAFPRSPEAEVTLYPDADLATAVLPNIGVPYRTAEEDAIFSEVADRLAAEN